MKNLEPTAEILEIALTVLTANAVHKATAVKALEYMAAKQRESCMYFKPSSNRKYQGRNKSTIQ